MRVNKNVWPEREMRLLTRLSAQTKPGGGDLLPTGPESQLGLEIFFLAQLGLEMGCVIRRLLP